MAKYVLLLIAIVFLTYCNVLNNKFVWDDFNNIVNNKHLAGPVNAADIFLKMPPPPAQFYRPLASLSLYFDYRLWADNPFGYHLTNLIFHLLNAVLVFYLAKQLTQTPFIALTCALLFALHPAQVEAVTYISGRSDPLCAFFLLSAFYVYLRHLRIRISYTASLLLFTCGLFSKEIALVFPLSLFFYESCFLKNRFIAAFKKIVPFLAIAAGFILLKYFLIKPDIPAVSLGSFYLLPKLLLFYLKLLVLPFNLHMQHNLNEDDFVLQLPYFICSAVMLGLCIFAVIKARKNKIFSFGLGWFLIFLFPFFGFLKLNADMAEHWLYPASFGFFLMLAQLRLWQNKIFISAAVLFLGLLTMQRNAAWRDDIAIYKDTLKYNFQDPRLRYNLGNAYLRRNLFSQALEEYSIAIGLNPAYAYAHNNMELLKAKQKHFQEAFFDHSLYQEVLSAYLKDSLVDYSGLKNNPALLDEYLKNVSELQPQALAAMPDNEKIALYLNTYNAFTLKAITRYYPVKSIRDIPGVWDKMKFKVAQNDLTLDQIEHGILRKEFKEPRVHFGLVCASKSCPELRVKPFTGKNLDAELDAQARIFINDKSKVWLDKENKTLYLSSIFRWFSKDFIDPVNFVSHYLSEEDARVIRQGVKVKYLDYDWSLNERWP